MPIPKFAERGVAFEIYRQCGCGYAVERCRRTESITVCPVCGGELKPARVDYPDILIAKPKKMYS